MKTSQEIKAYFKSEYERLLKQLNQFTHDGDDRSCAATQSAINTLQRVEKELIQDEVPREPEISLKLIDHVRDGQMATFQYFKDRKFFYKTDAGLVFPIPMVDVIPRDYDDTQGTTLLNKEKALTLMKWIKHQLDIINKT